MKNRAIKYLIFFAGGYFIFLCLLHYFSRRPLWLDEQLLFSNIQDFTFSQLFGPLKNTQVFPRAYLAIIKAISAPFSYNVLMLRLIPLLFMLSGFFLWFKIFKAEGKAGLVLLLLVLSFAGSRYMTYYAAEFKQYSCDLFAVAVFVMFVYYQQKYLRRETLLKTIWLFSLLTPVLFFFSYISALIAWVVAFNYLFMLKKNRELLAPFVAYAAIAAACFILVYLFDIRYSTGNQSMHDYWKDYFISLRSPYEFLKTLTEGMRKITVSWFLNQKWAMGLATFFMPFCWIAMIKLFFSSVKRSGWRFFDVNSLCLILVLELLFLGVFQIYPFTGCRITLFMAPFFFYMIVEGICLFKKVKFVLYPMACFYALFLCIVSYNLLKEYLGLYGK
jgi:hypothetical protein